MEAVKGLHPDEMSPREALDALYALKAKLPKGGGLINDTLRAALRRPFHHSVRFQQMQVARPRLNPIAEPNRNAPTCSTAIARPNPIRPQAPFAMTAAVAGPPMRGCRISIIEVNTIGNSASMPLMAGPTQPDSVTTVATSDATSDARRGISNQRREIGGIRAWR